MTPLTQDPTVIVFATTAGVQKIATNVAADIKVQVINNDTDFKEAAKGMPFVINVS